MKVPDEDIKAIEAMKVVASVKKMRDFLRVETRPGMLFHPDATQPLSPVYIFMYTAGKGPRLSPPGFQAVSKEEYEQNPHPVITIWTHGRYHPCLGDNDEDYTAACKVSFYEATKAALYILQTIIPEEDRFRDDDEDEDW